LSDRDGTEAPLWPSLPLAEWRQTHDTLHMWMQIVGKTRLALAPRQNHWWHVPLYLTSRGLTTSPIPYGARVFRILLHADRILKRFQGRFLGKSSPVHFFWGVLDLALTRFNGRRAPAHKDTDWWVLREANSHEEISFGFWPGSGSVPEPAFYAYARPEPAGLAAASIRPAGTYYSREIANFILPYDTARSSPSPDAAVLEFCQTAYDSAADLAGWDRAALDRPPAEWP
jgi:hypothetical protein